MSADPVPVPAVVAEAPTSRALRVAQGADAEQAEAHLFTLGKMGLAPTLKAAKLMGINKFLQADGCALLRDDTPTDLDNPPADAEDDVKSAMRFLVAFKKGHTEAKGPAVYDLAAGAPAAVAALIALRAEFETEKPHADRAIKEAVSRAKSIAWDADVVPFDRPRLSGSPAKGVKKETEMRRLKDEDIAALDENIAAQLGSATLDELLGRPLRAGVEVVLTNLSGADPKLPTRQLIQAGWDTEMAPVLMRNRAGKFKDYNELPEEGSPARFLILAESDALFATLAYGCAIGSDDARFSCLKTFDADLVGSLDDDGGPVNALGLAALFVYTGRQIRARAEGRSSAEFAGGGALSPWQTSELIDRVLAEVRSAMRPKGAEAAEMAKEGQKLLSPGEALRRVWASRSTALLDAPADKPRSSARASSSVGGAASSRSNGAGTSMHGATTGNASQRGPALSRRDRDASPSRSRSARRSPTRSRSRSRSRARRVVESDSDESDERESRRSVDARRPRTPTWARTPQPSPSPDYLPLGHRPPVMGPDYVPRSTPPWQRSPAWGGGDEGDEGSHAGWWVAPCATELDEVFCGGEH